MKTNLNLKVWFNLQMKKYKQSSLLAFKFFELERTIIYLIRMALYEYGYTLWLPCHHSQGALMLTLVLIVDRMLD